ncbi:DUF7738 domain-containing protein [Flavobacterium hydatis]|jgi:hypothetical protein|uniref:DUF7738 domain-containing protein n=1 Tax=Flavobacterium hydatis TaxID=991 RepID=A0A085ZZ85_FLAHY|nr:hypothetical protein [Flavobacterium hydatis]KFF09749.1 hypothetical protein IW20_22425 [Flavobacterium hydatis]OXA95407.1 hypothetical protein B0A62_08850 [Flavobacterium hydatis]
MKTLKIIALLFYVSLALQCQTKKESRKMETEFTINTQKVSYKGIELPLGKSLNEWVKILGKYDRVLPPLEKKYIVERTYTWDKLGIMVVEFGEDNEVKTIPELYVFFNNLDSPVGQAGKLEFARGRESLQVLIKRNTEEGYPLSTGTIKEIKEEQSTGSKAPKNYPYPFTTYKKSLNIEGIEIKEGMTISQINKLRKEADLPLIKYWDTDMNWKEEDGSTTTKSNGYFTYLYPHKFTFEEDKKANKYNILYRYTEQELEYIRIVYDTGQEY